MYFGGVLGYSDEKLYFEILGNSHRAPDIGCISHAIVEQNIVPFKAKHLQRKVLACISSEKFKALFTHSYIKENLIKEIGKPRKVFQYIFQHRV